MADRFEQEVLAALSAIWRDLLHLAEIDPDEDFIALGGDSLLALDMTFRVHEAFSLADPAGVIFGVDDGATLRDLCHYVAERLPQRPGR